MVQKPEIADLSGDKYKYGFTTQIETDIVSCGLNEDIIRFMTIKVDEFNTAAQNEEETAAVEETAN